MKSLSHIGPFATPWTIAYQAPLSMGFSRQEYCSGLPFPSLGDLPNPGIELVSPSLQADTLLSEPPGKPYMAIKILNQMEGRKSTIPKCLFCSPSYLEQRGLTASWSIHCANSLCQRPQLPVISSRGELVWIYRFSSMRSLLYIHIQFCRKSFLIIPWQLSTSLCKVGSKELIDIKLGLQ